MLNKGCILYDVESLSQKLNDAECEVAKHAKQRDCLKEDIEAVNKAQCDIKKTVHTYSNAREGLYIAKKDLKDYYDTKWRMILCAVESSKDDIDKIIREYDDAIADQKRKADDLQKQESCAKKEYEDATAHLNDKQGQFDKYKNYKSNLERLLNEIREIRGKIEKEDDLNHPASMYFLIGGLKQILDEADVISPEDLKKKLDETWCDVYEAKNVVRDKLACWEDKKADLEKEQNALKELETNRTENILNSVSKYNRNPEPCAPQTSEHTTSDKAQRSSY